jgi:hypothetical protein
VIFSAATAGAAQSATHIAAAAAEAYSKPGLLRRDILILLSRGFIALGTACQYPLRALRAIPAQAAPVPV